MFLALVAATLTACCLLPLIYALGGDRKIYAAAFTLAGLALAAFLWLGEPTLPDQPLAPRIAATPENLPLPALAARMETHLAQHPQDGEGWTLIAPLYLALGRIEESLHAYRRAIDLSHARPPQQQADLLADMGEVMVIQAGGVVEVAAKNLFAQALARAPNHVGARYYMALNLRQDGDKASAHALWQELAAELPPSPMLDAIQTRLME